MANVNINRTTTDTNDNVHYSYNSRTNKLDYKGIALLIIGILAALTIIWIIALAIASIGCWYTEVYECKETKWVFWGYIAFLSCFVCAGLAYAGVHLWNLYFNEQYLLWRGVITHRNDLRPNIKDVIAVAQISAKSEGTAGMDNYSPSITNTAKPEDKQPDAEEDGVLISPIGLGEV